jgi:hypothetical protein
MNDESTVYKITIHVDVDVVVQHVDARAFKDMFY